MSLSRCGTRYGFAFTTRVELCTKATYNFKNALLQNILLLIDVIDDMMMITDEMIDDDTHQNLANVQHGICLQ